MLPLPPPPNRSNQIVISIKKQTDSTYAANGKSKKVAVLQRPHRTNPIIWCSAIICLLFSLLLIFFGIATLIIFLDIKPKIPLFDTPAANLNSIYFVSPEYFNGDFTFITNFSNPNRRIDVRFEYLYIELYFMDRLIATQILEPFTQRRGETILGSVHLMSSLVYLPPYTAKELQKQVQSNRVKLNIRGSFRVRASLNAIHFSYRLHGRCQLDMTGPPTGILVTRSCRTKR